MMAVPPRARRRPHCPFMRMPIPFVTLVPEDGSRVKFSVEDRARVKQCGRKSLCQFCGTPLEAVIVFLGGETATSQRLFRQAPFHEECARYAIARCPYLRRTDDPQFATFCRRFKMVMANFPFTDVELRNAAIEAFTVHAVIRIEPVGKWIAA